MKPLPIVCETGTLITCPNCGTHIAFVIHPIYKYTPLMNESFQWLDKERVNGSRTTCSQCTAEWFLGGQLHTKDGWR